MTTETQTATEAGRLKVIAHRPFRDEHELAVFDPSCLAGFDGVELDLRCLPDGSVAVFHAPFLSRRREPAPGEAKPLETVLRRLDGAGAPTRLMFLDVKTLAAAERINEVLDGLGPERSVAFICWHLEEARLLRAAKPEAKLFLAMAPFRRARIGGPPPDDFFLFNRFPYIARARRYRRRLGQFNQHNINLRWLDPEAVRDGLPEAIDGICFHKRLFDRRIAAGVRAAGLELAVYGFPSRRDPAIERVATHIDYAIVDPDLGVPRRRLGLRRRPA